MLISKSLRTAVVMMVLVGLIYLFTPTLNLLYIDGFISLSIAIISGSAIFLIWKEKDSGILLAYLITIALFLFLVSALSMLAVLDIDGFLSLITEIIILLLLCKLEINLIDNIKYNPQNLMFLVTSILLSFILIGLMASSPLIYAKKMHSQLGKPAEKSFTEDILELDTSQIPTVDPELATKVGEKRLGEEPALGSQTQIGEFTNKQSVNGKLMYIAPLEHSGFFQWSMNKTGTTGYVSVSSTDFNQVELHRNVTLKYLPSSYFSADLKRHIWSSGFWNQGISGIHFELDDNENPFWIASTYENMTFWLSPEITGVVIVNPETGECQWYSVEDTPDWVDIIQPEDIIMNQLQKYGKYVHGVFNFSNKDKMTPTEHITTVYNGGQCYYYTGLSSVGSDEGTIGYICINTRDKSSKMYYMVGATESAAMNSVEGKLQDMGYQSTTPIPLNISGVPTYFSTLKDKEGLVKSYAMVSIYDYSIAAVGNNIMETKRNYLNAVNSGNQTLDFTGNNSGTIQITGSVTRIGSNVENSNTYYYLILDNDMSKVYVAYYSISEELALTQVGDSVKISFCDESENSINLISFNNLNIR